MVHLRDNRGYSPDLRTAVVSRGSWGDHVHRKVVRHDRDRAFSRGRKHASRWQAVPLHWPFHDGYEDVRSVPAEPLSQHASYSRLLPGKWLEPGSVLQGL